MKLLFALLVMIVCTSFVQWPCHPNGDTGICTHRLHIEDHGPCLHLNYKGEQLHDYDRYICTHTLHTFDVYPCSHVCY